jgi:hypothetical protein
MNSPLFFSYETLTLHLSFSKSEVFDWGSCCPRCQYECARSLTSLPRNSRVVAGIAALSRLQGQAQILGKQDEAPNT